MSPSLADAKAVFFDVDDTLYDFRQSMRHAFAHLRDTFPESVGTHTLDAVSMAYWTHYDGVPEEEKVRLIHTDPDLFRITMWRGTLDALGLDGGRLARAVTDEFMRVRPQHWRQAMYEGASDLLDALKPRLVLGAITNGPSNVQRPKLVALDYLRWFPEPRVFVSGEFGTRKPDPRIFEAAARAAGVEPQECVMVGDAREFDMPAKRIGFQTVLFTGPRERPDCAADEWQPDAIVSSYRELRSLLL